MRRRLATLLAVAVAALMLAAPSFGDGGWGSGGNDLPCGGIPEGTPGGC